MEACKPAAAFLGLVQRFCHEGPSLGDAAKDAAKGMQLKEGVDVHLRSLLFSSFFFVTDDESNLVLARYLLAVVCLLPLARRIGNYGSASRLSME